MMPTPTARVNCATGTRANCNGEPSGTTAETRGPPPGSQTGQRDNGDRRQGAKQDNEITGTASEAIYRTFGSFDSRSTNGGEFDMRPVFYPPVYGSSDGTYASGSLRSASRWKALRMACLATAPWVVQWCA